MQRFSSSWLSLLIYKIYPTRKESCLCRVIACIRNAAMNRITRQHQHTTPTPPPWDCHIGEAATLLPTRIYVCWKGARAIAYGRAIICPSQTLLIPPCTAEGEFPVNNIFWKHKSLGGKEYTVCVYITYYYFIIYSWVLYNICALYIIYMHMHIYLYLYMGVSALFLNQIFALFSSQIPQYFEKVDWISAAAQCRQSPRNGAAGGQWGPSGTRYSVVGNGSEDRDTGIAFGGGFIHPCPAALPLTPGNPPKWVLCSAPSPASLVRTGFPLLKGFRLPSDHHFQTDAGLNYHLFSTVISDMFTPRRLASLFTVTSTSVTLGFAAEQLQGDSEAGTRYHLKRTKLV